VDFIRENLQAQLPRLSTACHFSKKSLIFPFETLMVLINPRLRWNTSFPIPKSCQWKEKGKGKKKTRNQLHFSSGLV
jgi:hypothetical protein